jgi:hypothetical protein
MSVNNHQPRSSDRPRLLRKLVFATLLAAGLAGLRELLVKFGLLGFAGLPRSFFPVFGILAVAVSGGVGAFAAASRADRQMAQQAEAARKILQYTSIDEAISVHRDELRRLQVDNETARQLGKLDEGQRWAVGPVLTQVLDRRSRGFWREQGPSLIAGAIVAELLHRLLESSLWHRLF